MPAAATAETVSIPVQLPSGKAPSVQTLSGNVLPSLGKATPVSQAPDSRPMRIGIVIAHPHAAAEDAAVRRLYNPSSANFHSFMTPAAYTRAFGVSGRTASAVRSWLASNGLRLDYA
jgi:subtilase family serine protease